jgi:AcrR family transcriptional regulator
MGQEVRKRGRPRNQELLTRRCEEILDAATRVFAASGYKDTDVQAIADAVDVGKGTVYRYFPSKRELFLAAADRGMRRLKERVDAARAAKDDPLEQIVAATRAYLEFFAARPELVELLIQERANFKDRTKPTYFEHRDANIGTWRELFADLIRAGRVRDLPPRQITDVMSSLVYGTMFTNFFLGGKHESSARQAADIIDIVFHGILNPQRDTPAGAERSPP